MTAPISVVQRALIDEFKVKPFIDVEREIKNRVNFLANYLIKSNTNSLVLGISGGIDSTTAGRLCQLAVEKAKVFGHHATFYAVRLPYGTQRDESDAQHALEFINPDRTIDANIRRATESVLFELQGQINYDDFAHEDFVGGNIKARQRMIVQYAIAGATNGIVVGTDHAAEGIMGFFTKFGDGAADVLPLAGLNKRQVRSLAVVLGAPPYLVDKIPTADLEDFRPGLPDEVAHGVTYNQIDDFLEGKDVGDDIAQKIIDTYSKTIHKRALPVAFEPPTPQNRTADLNAE